MKHSSHPQNRGRDKSRLDLRNWRKKRTIRFLYRSFFLISEKPDFWTPFIGERLGQKCLTPRNKKKLTKIAFQIFVNFGLFPKELFLLPPFTRESIAKLIFRFIPHSVFHYMEVVNNNRFYKNSLYQPLLDFINLMSVICYY